MCYLSIFGTICLSLIKKMNLTGVAMETMRPAGPAKLSEKETDLYREVTVTLLQSLQYYIILTFHIFILLI